MKIQGFFAFAVVLLLLTTLTGAMAEHGKERAGRKLRYSGSWSGSWGSTTVNGDSGTWSTPYSSGSWGGGGGGGGSSTPANPTPNTNVQNDNSQPQAPSPGTVYYNGNGVLVQKLSNGQTQTVVDNPYTNVNVVSGKRRA